MKRILLQALTFDELIGAFNKLLDAKLKLKEEQAKRKQTVYLTRKEVASLLKITFPTLYDYTRLGYLKSYKIGARVLYKEEEVHAVMEGICTAKHKKYRQ
jgi:excisionase family DNA binding protein